jgi:hypothetical protein
MRAAQQLYEGVDIPGEGPVGLITYMRTDSTHISGEALRWPATTSGDLRRQVPAREAQLLLLVQQGRAGGPRGDPPTSLDYPPSRVAARSPTTSSALQLIWERFVACQMTPAEWDATTVTIWHAARLSGGQDPKAPESPPSPSAPPGARSCSTASTRSRRPQRRRRGRRSPSSQRGPARSRPSASTPAEVHQPPAALLRGLADQDARERGHRAALHLRLDHPGHPGPQVRRAARAALLRDRPRRGCHRQARRGVPQAHGRRLHPPDGDPARQIEDEHLDWIEMLSHFYSPSRPASSAHEELTRQGRDHPRAGRV